MRLRNPYTPTEPAAAPGGMSKGDWALMGTDLAMGFIPGVGTVWGAGRALWDAAHGNWAGAGMNALSAGLSLVGMGGAAQAGGKLAQLGLRGGLIGKGATGLMRAGQTMNKLPGMGKTLYKGYQTAGGRQILNPMTTGRLAHTGLSFGAPLAAGMVLPDNSQKPAQPQQPYRQYTGSPVDVVANELAGGQTPQMR